jgi:P-type Ca2+ transporter type 2C
MNETIKTWSGLSADEAARRLIRYGPNELPSQKKQNVFSILLNVLREPMLLLLIACGGMYLILGESKDAWMLLTFVFVVVGITFYQERKTERALDALEKVASPIAHVIRNGIERKIPSRELVIDDLIIIREGDRIPADAAVMDATNLLIEESILTGESTSVRKSVWNGITSLIRPGGEDLPFVFSGTLVTQGRAVVKVNAIGINTEVGKIGKSLQTIHEEDTLLKRETSRIVKNFAIAGIVLCITVIGIYGYIHQDWLRGILAGLTLSMAMLPEEFPVVLVIFLTLGAWRMSKRKVLVRKTPAIETLGAATVLCVDKTGTITENRMKLDGLWVDKKLHILEHLQKDQFPNDCHSILEFAVLASQKDPYDPMEKEIITKGQAYISKNLAKYHTWSVVREYPLSRELLSVSHVWKSPNNNEYIVAAKGAPEAIADLCHFSSDQSAQLYERIHELSTLGYRILGVAGARVSPSKTATRQHDYPFEFIGLMAFSDPIRTGMKQAVEECYTAGMRVIMITGDYAGTASTVARQIGLKNSDQFLTGGDLSKFSFEELRNRIRSINIFARVVPEQKLLLVNALKANGDIVAMTGDGVNDAPALKSAHIGIAMGERGTDVARETADLILLNDDFLSIVGAIRMGRRIFDNLKRAMMYIVSVHIPIAGMSLLPLLFGLPPVLLPAHIAFLELIIDPSCSVVFEAEEEDDGIMNRPPRKLKEPLFGRTALVTSLLQGAGVLVAVFSILLLGIRVGLSSKDAGTLAFVTIVIANILLIITNLSEHENIFKIVQNKNASLKWIVLGTFSALGLILYIPFLRDVFHFSIVHPIDLVLSLGFSVVCLIWFKIIKQLFITKSFNRI